MRCSMKAPFENYRSLGEVGRRDYRARWSESFLVSSVLAVFRMEMDDSGTTG